MEVWSEDARSLMVERGVKEFWRRKLDFVDLLEVAGGRDIVVRVILCFQARLAQ